MKSAPVALLVAVALATTAGAAPSVEPCGAGRAFDRHRYAFAYFYNGSPDAATSRVIGNAFAVHVVATTKCDPDAECETNGRSQWRVLFATAAHVMKDVCALQELKPPGSIKLVVPARPERDGRDTFRLTIDKSFCDENREAVNYTNNLFMLAREDGIATHAATLNQDDIRKNSDQWFFVADIETPDRDVVRPVLMGPLRKPLGDGEWISLRYYAFQNAPADGGKAVEEGVWWTHPSNDFEFTTNDVRSVYETAGWTTLRGASGSSVVEVVANGSEVIRAVGITTQFTRVGCSKAAGQMRPPGESDDQSEEEEKGLTDMKVNDLSSCQDDPTTAAKAEGTTTTFVPVMRFPPELKARFGELNAASATPATVSWTRSPELLLALRALVRSRQTTPEDQRDSINQAIKILINDIPPAELAFMLSGLAKKPVKSISPSQFWVNGCPRIEPSLEALQ